MKEVVIVSAVRTPIGSFRGVFSALSAVDLGAEVVRSLLARCSLSVTEVDELIFGQVLTAGCGQNPARQTALRAGLPIDCPAVTVNLVCGSGLKAVQQAVQAIRSGDAQVVIAGGQESMSNAPYLLPNARRGYRMGPGQIEDSMLHDGLFDELSNGHMGVTAENVAKRYHITRQECDELAVMSHQRACSAIDAGKFKAEIIPVEIKTRKGITIVDTDEHPIRGASMESLGKLPPAFLKGGVVTAGNASGINDAAAAVVVMAREKAEELGIVPLVKMLHICGAGVEPEVMGLGPALAIPKCLKAAGLSFGDIDYWEVNEAFAAQFIGVERMLWEESQIKVDRSRTNVNGSGISLGHPVGCTALRIVVTLIYEMIRSGHQLGGASLCVGGGPAMASLWERL